MFHSGSFSMGYYAGLVVLAAAWYINDRVEDKNFFYYFFVVVLCIVINFVFRFVGRMVFDG